jgi:hypothetical protein
MFGEQEAAVLQQILSMEQAQQVEQVHLVHYSQAPVVVLQQVLRQTIQHLVEQEEQDLERVQQMHLVKLVALLYIVLVLTILHIVDTVVLLVQQHKAVVVEPTYLLVFQQMKIRQERKLTDYLMAAVDQDMQKRNLY